jgi:hypothetical protein
MAAHSYSLSHGNDGFQQIQYTHGTLAPNANDIELRVNTVDQSGNPMTVKSIVITLQAFIRTIQDGTQFRSDWGV